MALSNLLSLTVRRNVNYEQEVLNTTNVRTTEIAIQNSFSSEKFDSISVEGKNLDITGNLTDEQIEALYKVGDKNTVNDVVDIITTNAEITDKELISIFLGKANAKNVPNHLRIVRQISNTPDIEDNADTDKIQQSDITLSRGDAVKSAKITSEETVLTLTNPFTGSNYQYTITSESGEQNATFEFLANGRLVITGDNIKIVASSNQKDDIILIGSYNELDTGDDNDIIRVNYCKDSRGIIPQLIKPTEEDRPYFWYEDEFGEPTEYYKIGQNNKINSGSGNDYVVLSDVGSIIDSGNGIDKVQSIWTEGYSKLSINNTQNIIYDSSNLVNSLDNKDGWACQSAAPDCRLFALINSLGNKNGGNLSSWAKIIQSGNNYTVTFPNYPDKSKNSITVSKSDIDSYDGVYGDLDTVIVDYALDKLISQNQDRRKEIKIEDSEDNYWADSSVSTAYYNTIAKYIIGSEQITCLNPNGWVSSLNGQPLSCEEVYGKDYQTCFSDLWDKYQNGEISNFNLGMSSSDNRLGIISGHAYSVTYYDETVGYIELVNPWDDADCLRLSLTDFFNLDTEVMVYGVDIYEMNLLCPNGGNIEYLSNPNFTRSIAFNKNIAYYGNNSNALNDVPNENLYETSINPFASQEQSIYDEIDEITASMENVKEILEEKKTLLLYS